MINIQNISDNECFKCCLVRYLILQIIILEELQNLIKNLLKNFQKTVTIRDIYKIEKQNAININVFDYENKGKHPIYVSKTCCEEKHVDLLLVGEERKRHYVHIKDFNAFMYDHTLHRARKHFCQYCLQALSSEKILQIHIKDCFKINGK